MNDMTEEIQELGTLEKVRINRYISASNWRCEA